MSRPVRTTLTYSKPAPPPTANEILESMRKPDPELIAKYPHADFNAAVRKAEHTEAMRRGSIPEGGSHISAFLGFAGSVKHATEQLMAQQEKEYLEKHNKLEKRRRAKENVNLLALRNMNIPKEKEKNKNLLVFPTREEELGGLFNSPASGAAAGAGGAAEAEGGRRRKRKTRKGKKRSYRKRTSRSEQ